jgi:hypothetical protein
MNKIFSQLAKQQSKLFKVNYSPEYKTFIVNYILSDTSHPLHEAQKRRSRERKKEGLWWHATTGVDLTKSSCVRAWARRRLRNAVVEELRTRGYNEYGKFMDAKSLNTGRDSWSMTSKKSMDLKGSLRLHVQAPLLPAKYEDIKAETGKLIDIIVRAVQLEIGNSTFRTSDRPQWNPPSYARTKRMSSPQWGGKSPIIENHPSRKHIG